MILDLTGLNIYILGIFRMQSQKMLLLLKEAYYINLICILAEYCEHPSSTYLSWRQSERDKHDVLNDF